ncbi:alanine--tRNA ligase-related protein [Streptomyces sp. NPDC006372]|uniref:alanine--tRNA ligase-related protein n=1 Tax=Streptomyces sp. NPDC006372 TaxID=3155599 RepID=UPI0033BA862E
MASISNPSAEQIGYLLQMDGLASTVNATRTGYAGMPLPSLAGLQAWLDMRLHSTTPQVARPTETWLRSVATESRTLALLMGSGITPRGRGTGHVVRRVLRECGGRLLSAGVPAEAMTASISQAASMFAGQGGFPRYREEITDQVREEQARFTRAVERAHRRYRHLAAGAPGMISPQQSVRLLTEYGLPLSLLAHWAAADRHGIATEQLAQLMEEQTLKSLEHK